VELCVLCGEIKSADEKYSILPKTPENSHEIEGISGKTPMKGNFST